MEIPAERDDLSPEIEHEPAVKVPARPLRQRVQSLEVTARHRLRCPDFDPDDMTVPFEDEIDLGALGRPEVMALRRIRMPRRLLENLRPHEVLQESAPQGGLVGQAGLHHAQRHRRQPGVEEGDLRRLRDAAPKIRRPGGDAFYPFNGYLSSIQQKPHEWRTRGSHGGGLPVAVVEERLRERTPSARTRRPNDGRPD